MTMTQRAALATVSVLGMIVIIWWLATLDTGANQQLPQKDYPISFEERLVLQQELKGRINRVSAEKPRESAGGFEITNIEYVNSSLARVHYNDGLYYYIGEMEFTVEPDTEGQLGLSIYNFRIVDDAKGRPPRQDEAGQDQE